MVNYINHNVNFSMLFLVLLATSFLVLSTVFFQMKYDQVVQDYNVKANELVKLSDDLQAHQNALGKVSNALKLAQEREAAFGKITAKISAERITQNGVPSMYIPPKKNNPIGTVVNSGFTSRPGRTATTLNGWGIF